MVDIPESSKPFFYRRGKVAALLLHGYTSTCHEVGELGEYLADRDITVRAPLLPGHGTRPEGLENITRIEWIQAAQKELNYLLKEFPITFIIGVSFGGNLAFKLATNNHVDGIISLGTPIKIVYDDLIRLALPLASIFMRFYRKPDHRKFRHEVSVFGHRLTYTKIPLKNLKEFLYFIEHDTPNDLKVVKAPALIMQSISDKIVQPKSASFIYEHLSRAEDKKLLWISDPDHVVTVGGSKVEVFDEIYQFIMKHSGL